MKKFMALLVVSVGLWWVNDTLANSGPKPQPRSEVIKRLCIDRAVSDTETFDQLIDALQVCI